MFNDVDNGAFEFVPNEEGNNFNYNHISGLGESDYENEDLFNVEVETTEPMGSLNFGPEKEESLYSNVEIPLEYTSMFQYNNPLNVEYSGDKENGVHVEQESSISEPASNVSAPSIDKEFLESGSGFGVSSIENDYELPVVEPTAAIKTIDETTVVEEKTEVENQMFCETPIEELNKLTEYKEEKVQTTDIKSLFDRVGVNVKEASDIFKKNTEMKEKIDSRFEELKKLQAEVEKSKKSQYDEINAYKEEVLGKLTEKKEEIEKRLNKLKEFQTNLENEKEEFEKFRKAEKEEIERVQKEVQDAYDSRREELNHIEDVLRRQKDALDEERNQLSLDKIQYESDKNELANNLLKFNEIVDSFTSGMDKINKE